MVHVLLIALGHQSNPGAEWKLGRARAVFDLGLARNKEASSQERMFCMMMGSDGCGMALYPVGRADRRFLLVSWSGGGELLYQKVIHGHPKTLWRIELKHAKRPSPGAGTIPKMLARQTYAFLRVPSPSQKKVLAQVEAFASYIPDPVDQLWVGFIDPGGRATVPDVYETNPMSLTPPVLPLTRQESVRLGFGDQRWMPDRGAKVRLTSRPSE